MTSTVEDNETWIYESPDGGKTVTRRPINNYDPQYKQFKYASGYTDLKTIGQILEEHSIEKELRRKHPVLQEKYDEYRALLEICKEPVKND